VIVAGAVEVVRDLTFASPDGSDLKLDLYLPPERSGSCPVVLYLHGGAFMVGDRTVFAQERLEPVARAGIAIASAQYRFSDTATYPAQVHDVKAAVRWLRAHAGEYGYGAEHVGAWGASAGGYLALMLGVTSGSADHEGTLGEHLDHSSSVEAVTAWFAVTDVPLADGQRLPGDRELPPIITGPPPHPSVLARLLGVETVTEHPELAAAASPVTYAAATRASFLLMHGDRDGLISEEQSQVMHHALVRAGADSTLMLIAGANHEDPAFHGPASLGAVTGFFRGRL
jgi:acetyl esterase/lipase